MCYTELLVMRYSHGSIKASAARVDEASDHCVEDEGQDLRKKGHKWIPFFLFSGCHIVCLCVYLCVCVVPAEAGCL